MNWHAMRAIYRFEMARTRRTLLQSIVSPVISTSLYFVVFGAAIGSRIDEIEGISYGAFIVPGLIMLSLLTQSVSNASFGIYFPKFTGTIYELLSAPVSYLEIAGSYVGAAATKSNLLGLIILGTAGLVVPLLALAGAMFVYPRITAKETPTPPVTEPGIIAAGGQVTAEATTAPTATVTPAATLSATSTPTVTPTARPPGCARYPEGGREEWGDFTPTRRVAFGLNELLAR